MTTGTRYSVVYGLTAGPANDLTNNGFVTYLTTHDRETADTLAASLNTTEGIKRLHAEIAAKPEYAGIELLHTTPAHVVELSD